MTADLFSVHPAALCPVTAGISGRMNGWIWLGCKWHGILSEQFCIKLCMHCRVVGIHLMVSTHICDVVWQKIYMISIYATQSKKWITDLSGDWIVGKHHSSLFFLVGRPFFERIIVCATYLKLMCEENECWTKWHFVIRVLSCVRQILNLWSGYGHFVVCFEQKMVCMGWWWEWWTEEGWAAFLNLASGS